MGTQCPDHEQTNKQYNYKKKSHTKKYNYNYKFNMDTTKSQWSTVMFVLHAMP